jgi:hypothetical protein
MNGGHKMALILNTGTKPALKKIAKGGKGDCPLFPSLAKD